MLSDKNRHYMEPERKVRSIQQALPPGKLFASGMMKIGRCYSATYRMKDVDFLTNSEEDQNRDIKAVRYVYKSDVNSSLRAKRRFENFSTRGVKRIVGSIRSHGTIS